MVTTGEHPEALRLVVVVLRFLARMSQSELGRAAGIHQGSLSLYESGQKMPTEEALRRIARASGVSWPRVIHLRRFLSSFLTATQSAASGEGGPTVAGLAVDGYRVEEAAAEASERAAGVAGRAWAVLKDLSAARRRRAIELSPRASRNGALAVLICEESLRSAADRAGEALELARLALFIAERVEGSEEAKRFQAYAWSHIGNALRVGNDFPGADAAFKRAGDLWQLEGAAVPHSALRWRMFSLESSLRREQRRFREALALLDRAAALAGGDAAEMGRLLLNKEFILDEMGDLPAALATLGEAASFVEASGETRLLCVLRFETAKALCESGRHAEASGLLPQIRELAERLSNDLDRLRVAWLAARIEAGLGNREEAVVGLEQVRREFIVRDLPYDAARASLELAVLFLQDGKTSEVKALAREIAPIFQAQGIARESLASLAVFLDAAQVEAATVDLARAALAEISRARGGSR